MTALPSYSLAIQPDVSRHARPRLTWSSTDPEVFVRVLGGFEVAIDGDRVAESSWTRRTPQRLIKLLAIQRQHALHREQIIDQLWSDCDLRLASNNLDKTIHRARAILQPDLRRLGDSPLLRTRNGRVHLGSNVHCDLDEFERQAAAARGCDDLVVLDSAVAAYCGPLLPDEIYEGWTAARREYVETLHRDLLLRLAVVCARDGAMHRAIESAGRILEVHATDEEAHRLIACILAGLGQRARAIRQLDLCAQLVAEDVGLPPSEATIRLRDQILAGRAPRLESLGHLSVEAIVLLLAGSR